MAGASKDGVVRMDESEDAPNTGQPRLARRKNASTAAGINANLRLLADGFQVYCSEHQYSNVSYTKFGDWCKSNAHLDNESVRVIADLEVDSKGRSSRDKLFKSVQKLLWAGVADTRAIDMYRILCEKFPEEITIEGKQKKKINGKLTKISIVVTAIRENIFPTSTYFHSYFFNFNDEAGMHPHLLMTVKLAVDILLFRRKQDSDGPDSDVKFAYDFLAVSSIVVYTVYKSWEWIMRAFKLPEINIFSYFIYFDFDKERIVVVPEGYLLPREYGSKIYIHRGDSEPSLFVNNDDDQLVEIFRDNIEGMELIRSFAKNCIDDIYTKVKDIDQYKENYLVSKKRGDLFSAPWIQRYLPRPAHATRGLPIRFHAHYSSSRVEQLAAAFASAEEVDTVMEELAPVPSFHQCPSPDCCEEAMTYIEEFVLKHCRVMYTNLYRDFIPFLSKDIINKKWIKNTALIVTQPPSVFRANADRDETDASFDGTIIDAAEMMQFVNICNRLLKKGGYICLITTLHMYLRWETAFKLFNSDQDDPVFEIAKEPLIIIPSPMDNISFTSNKKSYMGFLVWKKDGRKRASFDVLGNNNIIQADQGVEGNEDYWKYKISPNAYAPTVQLGISVFSQIISSLTTKDDYIMDPFLGTGSSAIACLRLPSYRNYAGVEIDTKMKSIAIYRLNMNIINLIENKNLAMNFPIPGEPVVKAIAQIYKLDKKIYSTLNKTRMAKYIMPPPSKFFSQDLPRKTLRDLAALSGIHKLGRLPLLDMNPSKWDISIIYHLLHCSRTLLRNFDATRNRLSIHPTLFTDHPAQIELRAQETIHPGDVIAYFFGNILYKSWADLATKMPPFLTERFYGEGILTVSYDMYKYARILLVMKEGSNILLVPNELCALSAVTMVKKNANSRIVVASRKVSHMDEARDPGLVYAEATSIIHPGDTIRVLKKE